MKQNIDLALIWAAGLNPSLFITLYSQGGDVNAKDRDGNTALHWAILHKCKETIPMLLSAGADINAANNDGETPLRIAEEHGYADMSRFLKENGAK